VEFGPGGPQVAIWVGEDDDPVPPVPAYAPKSVLPGWAWALIAVLGIGLLATVIIQLSR
jgi:hypothetical protein